MPLGRIQGLVGTGKQLVGIIPHHDLGNTDRSGDLNRLALEIEWTGDHRFTQFVGGRPRILHRRRRKDDDKLLATIARNKIAAAQLL